MIDSQPFSFKNLYFIIFNNIGSLSIIKNRIFFVLVFFGVISDKFISVNGDKSCRIVVVERSSIRIHVGEILNIIYSPFFILNNGDQKFFSFVVASAKAFKTQSFFTTSSTILTTPSA